MTQPTKEELQAEVDRLTSVVKDLEEQLAARDAVARSSGEPGWLITCRNPQYNGNTAGVEFRNGRAFIPQGKPGAARLVNTLATDFGYQVQAMTSKDFEGLPVGPVEPDTSRRFINAISAPTRV